MDAAAATATATAAAPNLAREQMRAVRRPCERSKRTVAGVRAQEAQHAALAHIDDRSTDTGSERHQERPGRGAQRYRCSARNPDAKHGIKVQLDGLVSGQASPPVPRRARRSRPHAKGRNGIQT